MPDPEETLADLSLDDMVRFFQSPAQAFLRGRLGMSLWDEDSLPADSEPLELDGLASYGLANRLLGIELGTEEKVDLLALEKAKGSLRKLEAARDIASTVSKSSNRVFLGADSLLLNVTDAGTYDLAAQPDAGAAAQ